MKSNSVALLVLLCTVAVTTWFRQGAPERELVEAPKLKINELSLIINDKPVPISPFGQTPHLSGLSCWLLLGETKKGGASGLMALDYSIGVVADRIDVNLSVPQWKSLTEKLSKLKGWRTEQCDDGTPQDRVLYTRLEMDTNEGQFVSNWRGFPPEQKLVMETLLASSFGPDLRSRLLKLSDPKAPLTIPF